jgi:ABC-type branched-subunit amino acid transport system substrate-binding protein
MRNSRRANLAFVAGSAVVAMVVAACGSSSGGGSTASGSSSPSASASGSSGSSSAALTASAPGITPTQILIGSHQPLTGVAAPGYDEIAPMSNAYFQYVNAHGGVYGRKIKYTYLNDQYNPTDTSTVVHQLVLQDSVYAIFDGLGTPTHLAVTQFLNSQKVPDVFVASGCECWDNVSQLPETTGWQLDYVREGKILGNYIKTHFKGKKVGVFYQDDEFGQDGLKGLEFELPKSSLVTANYNPANTNVGAQVATLKAGGAQVVVSFSVPAFTALLQLTALKLQFKPQLVVSDVGADPATLGGLLATFGKDKKLSALTNGIITDSYLPSLGDSSNTWIQLFKKVHAQYGGKLPIDGNTEFGFGVAYTFVQAMFKAGRNPTRADLLAAINAGLAQGPVVAPYAYSATDHDGVTGAYMAIIKNGALVQKGPVVTTDTSPTGPITPYTTAQPPAPASGIPSP